MGWAGPRCYGWWSCRDRCRARPRSWSGCTRRASTRWTGRPARTAACSALRPRAIGAVGADYSERSLPLLRDGGTLVSLTHPDADALKPAAAERGIQAGLMLVEPDRRALLAVSELVETGKLRAHIGRVLPLAEAAKAHELGETGRTMGKLVLTVD